MSGPDARIPRGTVLYPEVVKVHFDGACNPPRGGGIATYGFTIDGDRLRYEERGLAVRPGASHATNNVAEYTGAIRALEWLRSRGFRGAVLIHGDSQLVIRQMNGEYAIRKEHLKAYHEHLRALAQQFAEVTFRWVPREENTRADELTKLALEEARAELVREPSAARPDREERAPNDRGRQRDSYAQRTV
ncbi:MAG: ribonuclease HI family protein [Thermoplasmata archaeon]|nr:ribonuclease HI family protein [Thermoplasmata archaeon]